MKKITFSLICLFLLSLCAISLFGCEKECEHSYGDWEMIQEKLCVEKIYERKCALCSEIERKSEPTSHVVKERVVAPSCQAGGYTEKVCENCLETLEIYDQTEQIEHKFTEEVLEAATCNKGGYNYHSCQTCDYGYYERTDPTGEHSFEGELKNDSVHHWQVCSVCGAENKERHTAGLDENCVTCGREVLPVVVDVTLWVPNVLGYQKLVKQQIERFETENRVAINATILLVNNSESYYLIAGDPDSAPDLFITSQDSLPLLVQKNMISTLPDEAAKRVIEENCSGAVKSATVGENLCAYPMYTENGYYMYYDKTVITNPDSLEQIIADCEAAGKKFRFDLNNAWYIASFFFATGCKSEWTVDENGEFISLDDSFNSPEGLTALLGMKKLLDSPCYDSDSNILTDDTAVIITGTWNLWSAENTFGEKLGAADLPSFTVDGRSYHLGSYSGTTLMCVNSSANGERGEILHKLAEYLCGAECQSEGYDFYDYYAPTNLSVQENSENFKNNPHMSALAEQNKFSVPQRLIQGGWWDVAKMIGITVRYANTSDDLQEILDVYDEEVEKYCFPNVAKQTWSLIGVIEDSNWDRDYLMTEVASGVWESEPIYFEKDKEFLLRYNQDWGKLIGKDGSLGGAELGLLQPENIVSSCEGYFILRLIWDGVSNAKIEFIKYDPS